MEETNLTNEETKRTKANEEAGSKSRGSQPRFARCGDQPIVATSSDGRPPLFVTTAG